jgi:hypothetical protein
MKTLKFIAASVLLAGTLALTANADCILSPDGDIPKNGTGIAGGNSNNQANNFFRLEAYLAAHPSFDIGTPTLVGAVRVESGLDQPIDVTGFCYAVIHYGSGKGGTEGGGIAFFQIEDGTTSCTFPQSGSGPNGFGGISSLDLFNCERNGQVPDSGTTAMLLGSGLTALGMARRYLKR